MTSENLKALSQMKPNEKWWILSAFCIVAGVAVYLGVTELFGFKLNPTSAHAPLVVIILGIGIGAFATQLVKNAQIAQKNHELAMADKRKSDRPRSEPTEGDEAFWEVFKAKSPMTRAELQTLEVAHDRKKTKEPLFGTVNFLRFEGYSYRGKAVEYGNMYYTREQFENKDMTTFR